MKQLTAVKPKLGFAGLGWIGKNRLKAIKQSELAEITAGIDPDKTATEELRKETDEIQFYDSFEEMLESDLDGIIIATPNILHVEQTLAALQKGKAVFCQKPLGRNRFETALMVDTARAENVRLGVDFSYRHTNAVKQLKKTIGSGELGTIYAINLVFHNAYGPDKKWYYDKDLSGGGCLIDLGIHLIDLLYYVLPDVNVTELQSRLYCNGNMIRTKGKEVEDFAAIQMTLNDLISVQLSCSWNLAAGRDAVIEATFYGDRGGISFRNTDGSFYDFITEKFTSTSTEVLAAPPDDWQGRAAIQWTQALAESNHFDPSADIYTKNSHTLDLLYQHSL